MILEKCCKVVSALFARWINTTIVTLIELHRQYKQYGQYGTLSINMKIYKFPTSVKLFDFHFCDFLDINIFHKEKQQEYHVDYTEDKHEITRYCVQIQIHIDGFHFITTSANRFCNCLKCYIVFVNEINKN